MLSLTVFLFARAQELAGSDRVEIELPAAATVAGLRAALAARLPALGSLLERSAIAVNQDFSENTRVLNANDEVAVIPPVSGG